MPVEPQLVAELRWDDSGHCVLELAGELDLATAPEFQHAIEAACEGGAKSITVDLAGLTFIDSTGLRAILTGHEPCVRHRVEYWLARDISPPVRRLLEIAGVGQSLPFAGGPVEQP